MADRKPLPGKFVWYELVTNDAKQAQAFYRKIFGWRTQPFPMGTATYDMILTGDAPDNMIGGYAPPTEGRQPSRWISYVSVEDVDAAAKTAAASGGKVIIPPFEIPDVGRAARIADPQGAELYLHQSTAGDAPDMAARHGEFFWNELHTTDPKKALAFYEKVIGFSHRAMDMGLAGTYHIVSKGGVDRGGVTGELLSGSRPQWLPYVAVDDPDTVIARARLAGAKIPMPPEDIPGVGRFGVLEDPTGAALAIMKPMPSEALHEKAKSVVQKV